MAVPSFFQRRPGWLKGGMAVTTRWLESTLEVARWENMRKAGKRWGKWGVALGAVLGLILFAPATWLAQSVENLTGGRLLLAEAQGTEGFDGEPRGLEDSNAFCGIRRC